MSARLLAILLTVLAGAAFLWKGEATGGLGLAMVAALLALAALLLVSGRTRTVLAVLSVLAWVGTLAAEVAARGSWLLGAAGCGLAAALLTVVRGSAWPGWSDRFARESDTGGAGADDPRSMWDSLDRGEDPTHTDDARRAQ